MADEPNDQGDAGQGNQPGNDGVVTRPESIPEAFWDGEKNTAKFDDIGTALAEVETLRPLKAAADERAALIPAKPEDYKFDLPSDFELPGGYKWTADPKDPLVAGFREIATELKLTQPEVQKLVSFEAKRQALEIQNQKAFDAEQTKALGAGAEQRRTSTKNWLTANVGGEGAKLMGEMLHYAIGVEAVEALIKKTGMAPSGDTGSDTSHEKTQLVGTKGGAQRLLDIGNAPKA